MARVEARPPSVLIASRRHGQSRAHIRTQLQIRTRAIDNLVAGYYTLQGLKIQVETND